MANCSICGKSCGLMSGGKEPYTGHNLFVCNECGTLFKRLDSAKKEPNKEDFSSAKNAIENSILRTTSEFQEPVKQFLQISETEIEENIVAKESENFKSINASEHSENKKRICPICKEVIPASNSKCDNCGYSLEELFLTQEQKNAILESKQKQILKNAFYEYRVEIVSDSEVLGKTSKIDLEDTIMSYALNGWKLHSVTTSEVGKNAVLGINSTINNTILVFERCIKAAE